MGKVFCESGKILPKSINFIQEYLPPQLIQFSCTFPLVRTLDIAFFFTETASTRFKNIGLSFTSTRKKIVFHKRNQIRLIWDLSGVVLCKRTVYTNQRYITLYKNAFCNLFYCWGSLSPKTEGKSSVCILIIGETMLGFQSC